MLNKRSKKTNLRSFKRGVLTALSLLVFTALPPQASALEVSELEHALPDREEPMSAYFEFINLASAIAIIADFTETNIDVGDLTLPEISIHVVDINASILFASLLDCHGLTSLATNEGYKVEFVDPSKPIVKANAALCLDQRLAMFRPVDG